MSNKQGEKMLEIKNVGRIIGKLNVTNQIH